MTTSCLPSPICLKNGRCLICSLQLKLAFPKVNRKVAYCWKSDWRVLLLKREFHSSHSFLTRHLPIKWCTRHLLCTFPRCFYPLSDPPSFSPTVQASLYNPQGNAYNHTIHTTVYPFLLKQDIFLLLLCCLHHNSNKQAWMLKVVYGTSWLHKWAENQ